MTDGDKAMASPIGRALGDRFGRLPAALQRFHRDAGCSLWRGTAEIGGNRGWLARSIRRRLGMPEPAPAIALTVRVECHGDGSATWIRDYGERRFTSRFAVVPGVPSTIVEATGALAFVFRLTGEESGVTMAFVRWSCGRLPLPAVLGPRVAARESMTLDGRYRFDVSVALPLVGLVVSYSGTLVPERAGSGIDASPPA